ncbi:MULTISPECIES: response regulator [unclassified Achromobacter]|uniref:response regulator n=1 Tax=unclassified Achromobacter TaxID=2626865 RepID=UPI000B51D90B|nr:MULTISPECIES: response regulator [unclassified Achromobacter]OWT77021.1 response regulator [Achromobacter sp. HZ28]OWT77902.1 response regulator [Achromobacter sp. HZ34]
MALILVADDEILLAEVLRDILGDAGHEVVVAQHGKRALEMIRERRPALVISDFMMPIMTGLELAEAVKADAELADLPIVLVTGAQGHIARDHGDLFIDVLDKPYDLNRLIELIDSVVTKP